MAMNRAYTGYRAPPAKILSFTSKAIDMAISFYGGDAGAAVPGKSPALSPPTPGPAGVGQHAVSAGVGTAAPFAGVEPSLGATGYIKKYGEKFLPGKIQSGDKKSEQKIGLVDERLHDPAPAHIMGAAVAKAAAAYFGGPLAAMVVSRSKPMRTFGIV